MVKRHYRALSHGNPAIEFQHCAIGGTPPLLAQFLARGGVTGDQLLVANQRLRKLRQTTRHSWHGYTDGKQLFQKSPRHKPKPGSFSGAGRCLERALGAFLQAQGAVRQV